MFIYFLFQAKTIESSINLKSSREITKSFTSKLTNSLELEPGDKYQLNALVVHKFEKQDIDFHVDSELAIPNLKPIMYNNILYIKFYFCIFT